MQYYFDTSAVVKVYHQEEGSDRVLPIYRSRDSIVISEIAKVEFLSTLHKKFRTGEINADTLEAVRGRFLVDCSSRFIVVHVASFIVDAALVLLESHAKTSHLFSLDALQIATISVIADKDITFVCADKRLVSLVRTMEYPVLEV